MEVSKYTIYFRTLSLNVISDGITYGQIMLSQKINPPSVPKSMVNLKQNNTNTYTIPPSIPNVRVSAICSVLEHL